MQQRAHASESGRAPDVTVLVLMRNPGARELETLSLVRSQTYPGKVLITVIDSSDDPQRGQSVAVRESVDRYVTIRPQEFSHGGTRNQGVDLCTTPILVSLSSDAHPTNETWLEALTAPVIAGKADASYGRQRSPIADPEREATFGFLYPDQAEIKTKESVPELGIRTFHFTDVTSAFSTEVIREVRFPEVAIFQDMGLVKRLLDAGCRIAYVPEAEVYHVHPLTWRSMWARYRGLGEVCERAGIFDAVRRQRKGGLAGEGLRAISRMVPRGRRNPVAAARSLGMGIVKAGALAMGRRDAKKNEHLQMEWTEGEGSRAVRR